MLVGLVRGGFDEGTATGSLSLPSLVALMRISFKRNFCPRARQIRAWISILAPAETNDQSYWQLHDLLLIVENDCKKLKLFGEGNMEMLRKFNLSEIPKFD